MNAVLIHPLAYEDRPRGHEPDHFAHISETMRSRGHAMLPEERIGEADVLLIDTDVWHTDSRGTTSGFNQEVLKNVLVRHVPVVWFDHFDHAGDDKSQGRWPGVEDWIDCKAGADGDWQKFGYAMSRPGSCRVLYFMRKMQWHQNYPKWVYPLEYPILEDFPLVSSEELSARPFDVCGLANIALPRALSMLSLYRDGRLRLDCDIVVHYRRVDYNEWLNRHRQAKLYLDADASLGSERSLRLFSIAPRLRVRSDHRVPFPLIDMLHHVQIGDYDGHISKEDVDKVLTVVNDPGLLYRIYVDGAQHMRTHYSLEARSKHVVDLVEKFVAGEI